MSCPEMELGEYGTRLRAALKGQRFPLGGTIEVTERCNLHCVHCYINQPAGDREIQKCELTTEQWCGILDQIAEEGCFSLLLTGGEPFLRPDFLEIYDHVKRKGFLISLFTNGTLITPEIADHLREWHPYVVEITLYGATAETYERVTGVPGSFERCMRGVELLYDRGVPMRLKTMLLTLNCHEFEAIRGYVQGLGLGFRYDGILRPREDGAKRPEEYRLTPRQVVDFELQDPRSVPEWQRLIDLYGGPDQLQDTLYVCGGGVHGFHVGANGELTLCMSSRQPSYSLLQGDFHTGWHHFLKEVRAQKITKSYPCRLCEFGALCGYCPEFARLENGDPESVVEYKCEIAHLRAEHVFGKRGRHEDQQKPLQKIREAPHHCGQIEA